MVRVGAESYSDGANKMVATNLGILVYLFLYREARRHYLDVIRPESNSNLAIPLPFLGWKPARVKARASGKGDILFG